MLAIRALNVYIQASHILRDVALEVGERHRLERVHAREPREQARDEAVAGAGGVDDLDRGRGDLDAIGAAQELFTLGDAVTGIEVRLTAMFEAPRVAGELVRALDTPGRPSIRVEWREQPRFTPTQITELDPKRKHLAWLMLIVFILVFIPVPLVIYG